MAILATHDWPGAPATDRRRVAVLVHGVAGWHRTWWRVGPAIAARGWRVVAVDQRGHGHSPRMGGPATVADLAADLEAAVRAIGVPVDALIGHSLGASVVAELLFKQPELAKRAVLEDPPGIIRAGDDAWLDNLEAELAAAHADPEGEVARELAAFPAWLREDAVQDVEGKQLADAPGILASMRQPTGSRVVEIGSRLAVPALYILADERRSAFPADARRQLRAGLPADSRVIELDGGHTLHRDRFDEYMGLALGWIEA